MFWFITRVAGFRYSETCNPWKSVGLKGDYKMATKSSILYVLVILILTRSGCISLMMG